MTPVEEIAAPDRDTFDRDLRPHYRPVVIRGAAKDWPIIEAGRRPSVTK